jgi:hypothetical protein
MLYNMNPEAFKFLALEIIASDETLIASLEQLVIVKHHTVSSLQAAVLATAQAAVTINRMQAQTIANQEKQIQELELDYLLSASKQHAVVANRGRCGRCN